MLRNAWLEIRRHPNRITALVLAIMISTGFMVATVVFVGTETQSITKSVTAKIADSNVIIDAPAAEDPAAVTEALSGVHGVDHVEPTFEAWTDVSAGSRSSFLNLHSVPSDERLQWADLTSGEWPGGADQIVIGSEAAASMGVSAGDTVTLHTFDPETEKETPRDVTVSGIIATHTSLLSGAPEPGFATASLLPSLGAQTNYLVLGDGSVSDAELADRLTATLNDSGFGQDASVQTAADYEAAAVKSLTGGADTFRNLLLAFCAIALLVGCIIIANTFSILIAQRRRQIGLLRTVGAAAGQVRRGLLIEAALIGLIGSVLGVLLGIGVAAVAAGISGSLRTGLDLAPGWLAAALVVGTGVTVLAAMLPARRAMRIAPLEVLRPATDPRARRRTTWAKAVLAGVLVLVGAGAIALGLTGTGSPLMLAIAGSAALTIGILVAAPFFLPPLLKGFGRLVGLTGPTARLAATNTVRNPGRAAATCTALMVAIGLIVTLQVGSASIQTTLTSAINDRYPVDLSISRWDGSPVEDSVVSTVTGLDDVSAARAVPGSSLEATAGDLEITSTVLGLDPSDPSVIRGGLEDLTDDRLLIDPQTAAAYELESGDVLTVQNEQTSREFHVWLSNVAHNSDLVITADALAEFDPAAEPTALWAEVGDKDRARAVSDDLRSLIDTNVYDVSGSLGESAMIGEVLDIMLGVATALLAVAVAIALIGVGNTLGLSVIERTRESALLRALGLQRGSLRAMLAVEAVLLAVVGALVGIGAGVLFGWVGTAAMAAEMDVADVRLAISVPQTLGMIAIALLAGMLASVLPARRAAMAAPTEALAEV